MLSSPRHTTYAAFFSKCTSSVLSPLLSSSTPSVERSRSLHSALKKTERTAAEKKVVHFADSMGFDLVQVRCVFPQTSSDEDFFSTPPLPTIRPTASSTKNPPVVPRILPHSGSFNDARFLQLHPVVWNTVRDYSNMNKQLMQRTASRGVCLKSSNVIGMTFTATVSVYNYSFNKKVYVRYTLDSWRSFTEISARYVSSIVHENVDLFSFSLFLPHSIPVGAKCEFAIRYECNGRVSWDNNEGRNYVLECRSMADSYGRDGVHSDSRPVFY